MTKWIDVRDKFPPTHMYVLVYVKNKLNGCTEDYVIQALLYEYDQDTCKAEWQLAKGDLNQEVEEITHWTLPPTFPNPWKL